MRLIELDQGTNAWHAHRAAHFNASDCAAMLGVSPYKTRDALLREKATGIVPDVDEATQRRFDIGHRFEALARPLAEGMVKDEMYPCVGVLEGTKLSASFDGLTMEGSTVWECKSMNSTLRELASDKKKADELPLHYRAQMEQQLLVSGAEEALFSAVAFDVNDSVREAFHWQYKSDPVLRQRIIDGWAQFEKDLAAYEVQPLAAPKPAGRAPDLLPALSVQVTGRVVASNVVEFKHQAYAVLDSINRVLQSDEDFADAESTIKWCKEAETRIAATKDQIQGQMADIDTVLRTLDDVSEHTRKIRLELDKLVKVEKENRKLELVRDADHAITAHYDDLNGRLSAHDKTLSFACAVLSPVNQNHAKFATIIKGMRSLDAMQSALNAVVAEQKIAADAQYLRIEANIKVALAVRDQFHLFPDMQQLIETKAPDDLQALITARLAEDAQRQAKESATTLTKDADKVREVTQDHIPDADKMVRLGEINAAIAPLSIQAEGLAQLGFPHTGTDRAAKLYRAADFPRMRQTLIQHLAGAQLVIIDQLAA